MRRVVVTGLGLVTPLGVGVRAAWSRLIDGKCHIVSTDELGHKFRSLPCRVAGLVPHGTISEHGWNTDDWMSKIEARRMAKFSRFAIAAAEQALQDSGMKDAVQFDRANAGVCFGSGIGNLNEVYDASVAFEAVGHRKISPLFVPRLLINMAAGHIAMKYNFQGPNHAPATACTTGAHAIGDASRLIAWGDADVMLAGAAESCIHPLAIAGFTQARSLATNWNENPNEASRPFDRERAGFVMGEGAGAVVLEELDHAKRRGATIYAELSGYGLSGDAYHMTAPRDDGQGAIRAMRQALRHAARSPKSVDYVNAHATSTIVGDAAENKAIKSLLLGEHGKHVAAEINVSSTKGAVGHLLGAAGAVEAIFTILTIHEGILPPTLNLLNPGSPPEDFDCNYVPLTAQKKDVRVALTNSFGFGGTNSSLCFTRLT